jgi:hypothetical protein
MRIALFVGALALSAAVAGQYPYDQPGDKKFVNNTAVLERTAAGVANNQSTKLSAPRAQVTATFTNRPIVVDGVREAAWDAATPFPIAHAPGAPMRTSVSGIPGATRGAPSGRHGPSRG